MLLKKIKASGNEIIAELEGSLHGDDSSKSLEEVLDQLLQATQPQVVLNLSKVPAINSANLGKLFSFFNKLKSSGRTLKIKGCSETLYKTFQLIEMENHITYQRDP